MGIEFLPMKALVLIIVLLGAIVGGFNFRKTNAFVGVILGGLAAFILFTAILWIMPAKLTTNTKEQNARQVTEAYSRHSVIPEKVEVKTPSFEEMQAKEQERSNQANKLLKEDLK